ncbi:MAG: HAD family hydrolase [Candidatus Korarchaeum sp.]|nr:HAD family hydrolase [Candidatus Korarchaeum sp.]MDW8035783.1 HAD family hydrolase [Candidatus Korarchaeum sp.]
MPAATFDVWSTLLNLNTFYELAAKELSSLTGMTTEDCLKWIYESHSIVKEALRKGEVDEGKVIESSTSIAVRMTRPRFSYDEIYSAFARAANRVSDNEIVLEGAKEVIQVLKSKNYKLATVGNVIFWPGYLNRVILDKADLSDYFDVQVYADEVGCLKPNPKIFRIALDKLGSSSASSVHVGDSIGEDLAGAIAAGMAAVLVDWGRGSSIVDKRLRIAVVSHIRDVLSVIEEL